MGALREVFYHDEMAFMKIGFLLNHYDVHQVPHIVPYAFEISLLYEDVEVDILCSSKQEEDFTRAIGKGYDGHRCRFVSLAVPAWVRVLDPLLSKAVFARKSAVLKSNFELFASLDVLVTPEMTSLSLKDRAGFENTKLVFTGHGAGDNRYGGSFNERIGRFDLALMPGRKYAQGLLEVGYLSKDKAALVGYPKLEAMKRLGVERKKFFDNDRPTVIFNPHHNKTLSCWHDMGTAVLDYFYDQEKYNLIFCPHTVLFKRAWTKGARLPDKYKSCDHVLIDTGSLASADMTYLRAGDIYLGDVSSQVYEFLETPRPCVFIDTHQTDWRNNPSYLQWTFGAVIDHIDQLDGALDSAVVEHDQYRAAQVTAFEDTFDIGQETAGARGAHAIMKLAKGAV